MTHEEIRAVFTRGKKPTYARIVVDFRPQKEDPNRVRITAGGNLIQYAGDLTTRTADLTVTKMVSMEQCSQYTWSKICGI